MHTRLAYASHKYRKQISLAETIWSSPAMMHENATLSLAVPMTSHPVLSYKNQIPPRSYRRWVLHHGGKIQRRRPAYPIDGSRGRQRTRIDWGQDYGLGLLLRGWSCGRLIVSSATNLAESGVSFTNASCSGIKGLVRSRLITILSADGEERVADARRLARLWRAQRLVVRRNAFWFELVILYSEENFQLRDK